MSAPIVKSRNDWKYNAPTSSLFTKTFYHNSKKSKRLRSNPSLLFMLQPQYTTQSSFKAPFLRRTSSIKWRRISCRTKHRDRAPLFEWMEQIQQNWRYLITYNRQRDEGKPPGRVLKSVKAGRKRALPFPCPIGWPGVITQQASEGILCSPAFYGRKKQ